jgi:hypothetical protein
MHDSDLGNGSIQIAPLRQVRVLAAENARWKMEKSSQKCRSRTILIVTKASWRVARFHGPHTGLAFMSHMPAG